MDQLVKEQTKHVKIIKKIAKQISKDSSVRKSKEYGEARLHSLNTAWEEIEDINIQLEALKEQNPSHKYFIENYYSQIETLYDQTRDLIENLIRDAIERKRSSEDITEQLRQIKKQAAIIDTLKRNISNIQADEKKQHSPVYYTQKIKLLTDYWELIVHSHASIMALGKFKDDYFDQDVFAATESIYQEALIQLQEKLQSLSTPLATIHAPSATTERSAAVKLPRIDIPIFSGDYLKWPSFRNLFIELIHKNNIITKAEKLFYLKANVNEEPNELIQHFTVTNENYDAAWEILDRRYNNTRTLVSAQLRRLCNQPELLKESSSGLKKLHDSTLECLEAIKNLDIDTTNWDPIIIHLLIQKLDKESRKIYEQSLKNPREIQALDEFLNFLENRFQVLESMEPTKINQPAKTIDKRNEVKIHHGMVGIKSICGFCKANHKIYTCEKFNKLSASQRNEEIRKEKLCSNCLVKGHAAHNCKSWKTCRICNRKHHTLLHLNSSSQKIDSKLNNQVTNEREPTKPSTSVVSTHITESKNQRTVLLATAMLQAVGKNNNTIMLRALIDQGAQASFITEEAAQKLKLPRRRINATVTAVGGAKIDNIQTCIELTVKPRFPSSFFTTTTALVLKKLTRVMPSEKIINKSQWKHTTNLILADPDLDEPRRIDVILGAEVFAKILMESVLRGPPETPIAQETQLGWILSGEVQQSVSTIAPQCYISEVDLNKEIRKFWEIEDLNTDTVLTGEDMMCETHFRTTHRRNADGRYTVRLPFRKDPGAANLGGSREIALARLLQMEKKFKTERTFEVMYKDFMSEYLKLGHMTLATDNLDTAYYLPHHAVLKQDSTTTKLRVVFDGTAKRNSHESLNEILLVGPQIQQNLISILLRWRKHKVVFTSDIEKMYRQVNIDIRDQNYQRILWRNSEKEPIKEYKLTTVTYGTTSAPFLAIRTLQELAKDTAKDFPFAEKVIMRDTYVDDIVSGGDSLEEVSRISHELINALKSGGFNLRKWSSNNRELLQKLPWEVRESATEMNFDHEKSIKALGVHWNPSTDYFKIKVNIENNGNTLTKREILSEAAKIFDPIGLLAPIIITIKLLFQEIWAESLDWDQPLPGKIKQNWNRIKQELPMLTKIKIARWIGYSHGAYKYELHGFSDASEKAYSAAIYFRTIHHGKMTISLLTAKTKVAPLKSKLTLPKLELCGAHLLAKLLKETIDSLEIPNIPYFAWTDSRIVLSWINADPHKWKTFVGNRIAEIQLTTIKENWYYVKSSENPADVASRGIYPSQLEAHSLWWEGPYWLKYEVITYPEIKIEETELERKKIVMHTLISTKDTNVLDLLLQSHLSLWKVLRIFAYCKRFINNLTKYRHARKGDSLTVKEFEDALISIIKYTQEKHFIEELQKLRQGQELSKSSRLLTLNPLIDSNEVLRVGGRLENSNLAFEQKHPIIIPHKSELTTLIIDQAHKKTLHGGNTLTLEVIRQKYWIINGLKAVKGYIHKCVQCHRYKAEMSQQMMGMLPTARVTPSRPFTHTGVDYAGPFDLLVKTGRGNRTYKGYVAIFICLTTKAIHIEVVTDLTSKAFIAAFKRLVSRRGPVAHVYSDNATNFVGASKIISNLHQQDAYKTEVSKALSETDTQWHFIPPSSPHFGGLWEAGVKSIKHHMRRVVGETRMTYEEMTTLMTQIEGCLNSRPLCPLTQDPESLEALTPGHFLTGAPILSTSDKDYLETNTNLLKRWDRVEKMHQDFWKRWSNEYLGRLQQRPKWAQKKPNPTEGDIVLIKEDNLPPSRWALGRIIKVHPGNDGLVRVVTLKTKSGTLKRPLTKISLLPISNDQHNVGDMPTKEIDSDNDTQPTPVPSREPSNDEREASRQNCHKRRRSKKTYNASHSKMGRHEPETSSSSSNHARKSNFLSYLFIITTLLVIALGENVSTPYRLTKLDNHEGLYFDEVSEMRLYFSEWNLVVYYNLSTYWKELYGIRKSIRKLNQLCDEETRLSRDLCYATTQTLKHQVLEIEQMNEILYQQNDNSRIRNKRAPIEFIGTVANKLFGILDQDFADQYEMQIKEIKANEDYARQLLRNQTSIVENTVNIMKRNNEAIQHQLNLINTQIETIVTQLNSSQHEAVLHQAVNSAAILITLNLVTFQRLQREILSLITDIKQGKINTLLLTPAQLNEQLTAIREHLPPNVQLPGTGSKSFLITLYNSMHVRTRITEKNVLFDIRIPLVSTETYRLYEIITIPTSHNEQYIYIDPSSKYLAINQRRDRFSPIEEEDLKRCERLTEDQLVCNLNHPIFTLKSNQSHCEMELFNNENHMSPFCTLRTKEANNYWRRLHQPSTWLFVLREKLYIEISCENKIQTLSLYGNGIIQIRGDCMINHKTLYISSNDRSSRMHISPIPENTVISNFININKDQLSNASRLTIPQLIQEVNNNDLEKLDDAIRFQQERIEMMPKLNIHDLHHYSMPYLIICGVIAIGLYIYCRRKRGFKLRSSARPIPAPRSIKEEQRHSSIELPTLNLEAGECTEYI